jgi:hypothetical protein
MQGARLLFMEGVEGSFYVQVVILLSIPVRTDYLSYIDILLSIQCYCHFKLTGDCSRDRLLYLTPTDVLISVSTFYCVRYGEIKLLIL